MSSVGDPNGKPAVYSLGNKSLYERVYEEGKRIGKRPSLLNILIGLNKKKDKAIEEPTGEVYNSRLEQAYQKYLALFREQYGEDADPLQVPWDKTLWKQTEPVRERLGKCRMLGADYNSFDEPLMDAGPSRTTPASAAVIEDLQRRCSEVEARNKAFKQKVEEV
ncbi:hypothetical protein LIER_21132 [Lithospermum erythrorhizon]|uniref:Uncharacterized protein n=1 Tax=Lithospermum erythrorhizon TaxID=34254 RepID=A0AAV3QQ28_LITER